MESTRGAAPYAFLLEHMVSVWWQSWGYEAGKPSQSISRLNIPEIRLISFMGNQETPMFPKNPWLVSQKPPCFLWLVIWLDMLHFQAFFVAFLLFKLLVNPSTLGLPRLRSRDFATFTPNFNDDVVAKPDVRPPVLRLPAVSQLSSTQPVTRRDWKSDHTGRFNRFAFFNRFTIFNCLHCEQYSIMAYPSFP